jgi:hypothetical protein
VAKPSNADLDRIAPHLFLFQDDAATRLPAFVTDAALAAALQPVISDERFDDLAFAVVQHRAAGLRAFAHQPNQSWDIGSAGKITILLGALTVLRDVEALDRAGLLAGVSDQTLDAWFRHVWSRHTDKAVRALTASPHFPQASRIVTRSGGPIRLSGGYTIDFPDLTARAGKHIDVTALAGTSFSERLHLAIGRSDNRAARACQGEVGIGFVNAVARKLGLYDAKNKLGLRIVGEYGPTTYRKLPAGWRQPASLAGRAPGHTKNPAKAASAVPYAATPAALARLMTAIIEDRLHGPGISVLFRNYLLRRPDFSMRTFALPGVRAAAADLGSPLSDTDPVFTKLGIKYCRTDNAFFAVSGLRYSLTILGLLPKAIGAGVLKGSKRAEALGEVVHRTLHAMP